jgi:hypothetical protein
MDVDVFVALETQVWEALRTGDPAADARLLSDDFVGVYSFGIAGKENHTAVLANGPVVESYEIHGARLIVLTDDHVMLCYRAVFVGVGESAPTSSNYISSLWSRRDGEWLNVFSQDTEVAEPNT